MPKRSKSQRIGDLGEQRVFQIIDEHKSWVARTLNRDYGIDLEAEVAQPDGDSQNLLGKIIKLQIKSKKAVSIRNSRATMPVPRTLIEYAKEFKLPVILVFVCLESNRIWWVWLQEWAMLHEEQLAKHPDQETVTVSVPVDQQLETGLDEPLQKIARGETGSAMVLSLRDILSVSVGWENKEIADGVAALLTKIHGPSRTWMIEKTIDVLLGYGEDPPFWRAQQVLPGLLRVVDAVGYAFTQAQLVRLVARGETSSRTGLFALGRLYDRWPDHARSLRLPSLFLSVGSLTAAWYAEMRERFPMDARGSFASFIANMKDVDLRYQSIELVLTPETRDYIMTKWPNRGDSVLIDRLRLRTRTASKQKRARRKT